MAHTAESFCEVWGSPVAHSLSPALHRAAYEVLGLDWDYRYRDVTSETLALTWEQRGSALAGLSLTMPLKEGIVALVEAGDPIVAKLQASAPTTNKAQRMSREALDPLAERIKGLGKQVELLYRLLGTAAAAAGDLAKEVDVGARVDRRGPSK